MGLKIKNGEMRDLVEFAQNLGYSVEKSKGGHIKFVQPGVDPTFTSATPSDHRSWKNCRARLRRAVVNVGGCAA